MRESRLKHYLLQWKEAGLINEDQVVSIGQFMKANSRRQYLRLIRVLFILGAFWLVFGLIATLQIINLEWMVRIAVIVSAPIISVAKSISPKHYQALISGIGCLAGWALLQVLGMRLRKRSEKELVRLGQFHEKELRLGVAALTMSYISATAAWMFFNHVIGVNDRDFSFASDPGMLPVFSFVGAMFFVTLAYSLRDQIALLFGIGFIGHIIGLMSAYTFASYWISVSQPATQCITGAALVLLGLLCCEKYRSHEDHFQFSFGRTYQWTGLLFIYLSLWVMAIWGISSRPNYWSDAPAVELWTANVIFIAASLGAVFYGASKEDRLFFNFGLTFFIIETYTLFFSHIWRTLGAAIGSLILGVLMIATGYALRHLWLVKGKGTVH